MAAEEYEEQLLKAGGCLGDAQPQKEADHQGMTERAMRIAPMPDPMHGDHPVWGSM